MPKIYVVLLGIAYRITFLTLVLIGSFLDTYFVVYPLYILLPIHRNGFAPMFRLFCICALKATKAVRSNHHLCYGVGEFLHLMMSCWCHYFVNLNNKTEQTIYTMHKMEAPWSSLSIILLLIPLCSVTLTVTRQIDVSVPVGSKEIAGNIIIMLLRYVSNRGFFY